MSAQAKVAVADVMALVEPTRGNVAAIARQLGVTRATIWHRCQESSTLMAALQDAREGMKDNAESMLYKKVLEGDMTAVIFFLKTQGRDRGYVEQTHTTGDVTITVKREKLRDHPAGIARSARANHRHGEPLQRTFDGETLGENVLG